MTRFPLLPALLALGYAFLYAPILLLAVFSLNSAPLLTEWGGTSLRWYRVLFSDAPLLHAAALSLRIAAASATLATALGLPAGLALARYGRFRGRTALSAAIAAPLVMPDVLVGLSLLLLFVLSEDLLGFPEGRGALTVTLAHATFSLAYVAVVVAARLRGTEPDLEEAAADLGAPPWRVFARVTVPLAAPALVSGWLLAFTLSLDDLVVASFTSGPGASTLPMVVFSSLRLGATPELYALSVVVLAVCSVALGLSLLLARRR